MNIVSWNLNGMRAVERQGFGEWVRSFPADLLCFQEIKLQENQVSEAIRSLDGYTQLYNCAEKKGYAGVAVFTVQPPLTVHTEIGHDRFDAEGRMLCLEFPECFLVNLYLPHGGRQKEHLAYKLEVYAVLRRYLSGLSGKPIVLTGDFNIAHSELDLARPTQNRGNIMFTPEERAQLDQLTQLGYHDTFRALHPEERAYSWWPYLASARANNIGWRIDYIFTTLSPTSITAAGMLPSACGSDHCPVFADLLL
ncbi:exodeoxyribonuclease III [Patescibacteria group bacterium]|nr:exodeoxyribonuclease III [Patescibacteria group bacterium]